MRCGRPSCLGLIIVSSYAYSIGATLRSPTQAVISGGTDAGVIRPLNWDLEHLPDSNSTDNYIFDGVASVLQHWMNTRYRNGHSIIPGTVLPGTLLYHGRANNSLPIGPEWVATDPEHSYLFCRNWHLTLAATRPLNVLYFDGSSAANMAGPIDTQDFLIWDEPGSPHDDRRRVLELCAWGKQYALDGFVRMEMDFEIMLCNFTSGVEIVSFLNLTVPQMDRRPRGPGRGGDRESFPTLYRSEDDLVDREAVELAAPPVNWIQFEVINSGSWHNTYPGDVRIKLDLSRLVSFYDITLVPSLVSVRKDLDRRNHTIRGLDKGDLNSVRRSVANALSRSDEWGNESLIDWQTLVRVIIDRYGERLELLEYILSADEESLGDLPERASKAFLQLRIMLTPYLLTSAIPLKSTSSNIRESLSTSWASPIFRWCATTHTSYIATSVKLTPSERLILSSIQGTTREICRVLVRMWVQGVQVGLDEEIPKLIPNQVLKNVTKKWKTDLKALMAWLDWSIWERCKPACGFEEMCYMPTWPFFDGKNPRGPPHIPEDEDSVVRPKPMCIRRIEPYSF